MFHLNRCLLYYLFLQLCVLISLHSQVFMKIREAFNHLKPWKKKRYIYIYTVSLLSNMNLLQLHKIIICLRFAISELSSTNIDKWQLKILIYNAHNCSFEVICLNQVKNCVCMFMIVCEYTFFYVKNNF